MKTREEKLEDLALEMLKAFEDLGNDGMARISARIWFKYFDRKLKRLCKRS